MRKWILYVPWPQAPPRPSRMHTRGKVVVAWLCTLFDLRGVMLCFALISMTPAFRETRRPSVCSLSLSVPGSCHYQPHPPILNTEHSALSKASCSNHALRKQTFRLTLLPALDHEPANAKVCSHHTKGAIYPNVGAVLPHSYQRRHCIRNNTPLALRNVEHWRLNT